jgi:hypothetical protein
VAFLLTPVAFLLALGIGWAVDRSLRTLMPTRGDGGLSCGCVVARRIAHSSAVRAGRKFWWAHARFNPVGRR